ncbi:competence protein ComFC [Bacillus ectoiniformans]|uniref:ComF family protein n=1 Tax=Bacillus ectoiniformans TaxID=1494429 RepID=UPI00195E5733|nr:ComF family protein [Bacillus ectoiniformans]MBM7649355.1 competence protein ComFC [Bacillus ectoiniformans]
MSHCLYCGNEQTGSMNWRRFLLAEEEPLLCADCLKGFERIEGTRCQICSRSLDGLPDAYVAGDCCRDCAEWEKDPEYKSVLSGNQSIFTYNGQMKEFIAQLKYRGDYVLAHCFADEIRRAIKTEDYDLLTVIPLSKEREWERGFNQAKALVVCAGLEVTDTLKRLHTEKQSKKTRTERIHLPEVFLPADQLAVQGKKILIIDDIYTTGSTIRHAALVLKQAGAASVRSFTLSRG